MLSVFCFFALASTSVPIEVYEATAPMPEYGNACASRLIVNQTFANSYGQPVSVKYQPPHECKNFTYITAVLSITIFDHQYDRLMHFLKDGIEVWRPSTPEPVGENVFAELHKDISSFVNLFKSEGVLSFSLDNILSSQNDGIYHASLLLNFFGPNDLPNAVSDTNWFYSSNFPATDFHAVIANELEISTIPGYGLIPQLHRNTTRAVLNIHASGNSNEEFWYAGDWSSKGPTRLIELFVDGKLAGVLDPFPVVYTGGISPGLWHPVMGLKSSDVPSYIVDITPFLPFLWENAETPISIAVGNGYGPSPENILSNWIISVSLLTWEIPDIEGSGTMKSNNQKSSGYPYNVSNTTQLALLVARYQREVDNAAALSFYHSSSGMNFSGESRFVQSAAMSTELSENDYFEEVDQTGVGSSKYTWTPAASNPKQSADFPCGILSDTLVFSRDHSYPLQLMEMANSSAALTQLYMNRAYDVSVANNAGTSTEQTSQRSYFQNHEWISDTNITSGAFTRRVVAVNNHVTEDTYLNPDRHA